MSCSYIKSFVAFILGAIYLPLAMLGNGQLTICIAENGEMQLEYGVGACDVDPIPTGVSAIASDCGDCTDTQLQAGETLRINNSVDAAQIQNTLLCRFVDQKTMPVQTYIEPEFSDPDLIGSSILII
ncbi:MAG TPA: hypothetical protein VIJ25_20365 [Methylococcales bacterium]